VHHVLVVRRREACPRRSLRCSSCVSQQRTVVDRPEGGQVHVGEDEGEDDRVREHAHVDDDGVAWARWRFP
jgi:hypothetical protein